MPARQRGGSLKGAKSRPKASSKSSPRAGKARAVAYAPSKLNAAQAGLNISPALAGAVAVLILIGGMSVALATGNRMAMIGGALDRQAAQAGFKVARVDVQGASPAARTDILAAAALTPGAPILGLDLEAVRGRVEAVGWTRQAKVVRLLPDTVVIAISERPPLAVWQNARRLRVVDGEGRVIREADPAAFPNLPLVVGQGANEAAGDILAQIKARPRLLERMEALVRVDERRWDVRLKDGGLVQLPALDEDAALIRLDQLDREQRILELGLSKIDLRQPLRVGFRPGEHAAAATGTAAGV